jgi:hypothetical protein
MDEPKGLSAGRGGVYTFVTPLPDRWIPGNVAVGYWLAQADGYKLCGGSTPVLLLAAGEDADAAEARLRELFPDPDLVAALVWERRRLFAGDIQPGEVPPELTRDPQLQGQPYAGDPNP